MSMTRYGFIDPSGDLVIPSPHGTPFSFNEGRARMPVEKGWAFIDVQGQTQLEVKRAFSGFNDGLALTDTGFIDPHGQLVLPVAFKANFTKYVVAGATYVSLGAFSSGLALVMRGGAKGLDAYLDRRGEVVLDGFAGGLATPFVEGRALVVLKKPPEGERFRLINPQGEVLASFGFESMRPFSNGRALVVAGERFGFVDPSGAWVVAPTLVPWEGYLTECAFSGGFAPVKVGRRYGFIDESGNMVIEPRFEAVRGSFSEGLAAVKHKGLFGYVRPDASWAVPPRFQSAQPFSHGRAVVQIA